MKYTHNLYGYSRPSRHTHNITITITIIIMVMVMGVVHGSRYGN